MFQRLVVRRLLSVSAAACALSLTGAASGMQPMNEDPAQASLVAETDRFVPGKTTFIGIAFEIDDGWHLYWKGRNDTGFEPEIRLTLPPGFEAGKIQWPAPKRKEMPGEMLDHIYEHRLLLMIPVKVPSDAEPGSAITIEAEVDWLVCQEACIPGSAELSLASRIAPAAAEAKPSSSAARFEETRARLPKRLPENDPPVKISKADGAFEVLSKGARQIAFYPARECSPLLDIIADGAAKKDRLHIRIGEPEGPQRLIGIVEVWPGAEGGAQGKKSSVWWIDTAPGEKPSDAAPTEKETAGSETKPVESSQ